MPASVQITKSDGSTIMRKIPVDTWLEGATQAVITVDGEVTNIVIDPDKNYPDTNRQNNSWQK
jgi:hypothetical protein